MAPNEKQVEAWNGGESTHYIDHALKDQDETTAPAS